MGQMLEGEWVSDELIASDKAGRFLRAPTVFRLEQLKQGDARALAPEYGRYHLYVSYACPWAGRALAALALKGLTGAISVSTVDPLMGDEGWAFSDACPDPLKGRTLLSELYRAAKVDYSGRVTVPVLWDKYQETIVCNESSDLLRALNRDLEPWATRALDLYPEQLRGEIDEVNDAIYETLNNGVYRCGFAKTQQAYEEALIPLFETLDWLEQRLQGRRWLVGEQLTEADIRLFVTLIRFDPVYFSHFRCSLRRIVDYPELWRHTRDFYRQPGIAETVHMTHIKRHYFMSHRALNPSGIVPKGPLLDYSLSF